MATPCSSISSSKVRVVVRVRPFLPKEISARNGNTISCVSVLDQEAGDEVVVHLQDRDTSRKECYKLDSFFEQDDNNVAQIFYKEVNPLIPGLFHGCNATVFAYGATGSGKTYTMQGNNELPGLMPLAMSTILSMCQSTGSTAQISYYEVYLDRCSDLLEVKKENIVIWDDKEGQIHLKGLSQVPINSMSEFYEVIYCGIQRRKVSHTGLNDVSSRSHGVLVITVSTPYGEDSGTVATGKLNLIDLAGNEDNRRTGSEGIRLYESAKINQSLFALSNVIYALNNNKPRVPYRESKLTRILQDSLGGKSRALMVACLNPGEYQESVHTVSLAARSRHISNFISSVQKQGTPKLKVDMEDKLRAWLESKGKTKSSQRMGVFGSPFLAKTPSSVNSVKKPRTFSTSMKVKATTNQGSCFTKERAKPSRNLFNHRDKVSSFMESLHLDAEEEKREIKDGANCMLESDTTLPDDVPSEEDWKSFISCDQTGLLLINENRKMIQSSLRKALSPINSNISGKPLWELSSTDQIRPLLCEPETPKTPYVVNCANKCQTVGTPLDKFNERTSNLKGFLIQEYINFLNTASREELMELKGIGLKRAEYIHDIRETSPLQSLTDLKKIGLSSKEVHNMFSSAAKCILDRPV